MNICITDTINTTHAAVILARLIIKAIKRPIPKMDKLYLYKFFIRIKSE